MELTINLYDDDGNVIRKAKANTVSLKMGQVSAIMRLLDADNIETSVDLLNAMNKAWKQLVKVLSKIFPDIKEEEWDNVDLGELLPVFVLIIKESLAEMMKIPKSKNV
ncbi:MAG: hypothetical protein IIY21_00130 [Clostridiales bacterium]|nr:hypothetical protein [Clostridiales bacterium]MBQ1570950.1 hypothetical protein [Clostridiales bacterium]